MAYKKFEIQSKDALTLRGQSWLPDNPDSIVCLIHGLGEHVGRYAHVADQLNSSNIGLAGIDLRGHGTSDGKRGHTPSYDILLDDIQLFLDKIKADNSEVPLFLGHLHCPTPNNQLHKH